MNLSPAMVQMMAKQDQKAAREAALDALSDALSPTRVQALLDAYEATGDHNHGRGPILPGAACPGGDCLVAQARTLIAEMRIVRGL